MKNGILLGIVSLLFCLSSCHINRSYTFMQPFENVQQIELISVSSPPHQTYRYKEYSSLEAIAEIDQADWYDFKNAFLELACKTHFGDPPTGVYGNAIRVTYKDGALELIGVHAGIYYDSAKNRKNLYYSFERSDFESFFSKWMPSEARNASCDMCQGNG